MFLRGQRSAILIIYDLGNKETSLKLVSPFSMVYEWAVLLLFWSVRSTKVLFYLLKKIDSTLHLTYILFLPAHIVQLSGKSLYEIPLPKNQHIFNTPLL